MNTASTTSASGLAAPASAIDPVCGMSVQGDKAAARLELDGKLYLFCSTDCQHKFEIDPKKYIGKAARPRYRVPLARRRYPPWPRRNPITVCRCKPR